MDFVIATDNRSDDGTTEILERYERARRLHLIRESGEDVRQNESVTRMAATGFDADWVINADTDGFWWPRGGTLKDVLAAIPSRFEVVRGTWRHFLPRPEGPSGIFERMTVRLRDALRLLRTTDSAFVMSAPGAPSPLLFPPRGMDDDVEFVAEIAPLIEIDGIDRAEQRVLALEDRVFALERTALCRVGSSLATRISGTTALRRLASR